MTLITHLVNKDFAVIAGEGCTMTDNKLFDSKLRKVYLNHLCCVAFAGDVWITEDLAQQGIYVPNTIEKFLADKLHLEDCLSFGQAVTNVLIQNNQQLDTELFISMRLSDRIESGFIQTKDKTFCQLASEDNSLILRFSKHTQLASKVLYDIFYDLWHYNSHTVNNRTLEFNPEIHTSAFISNVIDKFYERILKISILFDGFTVGKSWDIVLIEKTQIKFLKKKT